MADRHKYLVTGASGFIGGWVVETLYLSGHADVRAGIHTWTSAARLGRFPVEIVACDVLDRQQVERAVAGVTHVIHCALGNRQTMVQGTRHLLEAAQRQGVQRVVYLSSAEVYGEAHGEVDESHPVQAGANEYADAKIEAEAVCWEFSRQGAPATVLRPTIVYGPFSADWSVALARRLQSGHWGALGDSAEGWCNPVYVGDVVDAILLAATREGAVGEAFNIAGPEVLTWNDYFRRYNAAMGRPALDALNPSGTRLRSAVMTSLKSLAKWALRRFGTPIRRLSAVSGLARDAMRRAEESIKNTPSPAELRLYGRRARYLTTKASERLGYAPRWDLDAGLQMTVRWLIHEGLLSEPVEQTPKGGAR
jgi:nucleoside-diphosphate-sugar epimerase